MKRREFLPALMSAAAPAQESPERTVIRTTVNIVVAPTTVLDKNGRYVNGLEARDFRLYDNEKLQELKIDVSYVPISLVVAVQASSSVEPVLPMIKKLGPLVEGLLIGEQGEAAVLAFDHRFREMTDGFTNDGKLVTKALEKINAGSRTSALVDSIFHGVRMLRRRPSSRRRILLIIAETMDRGSEGRLREALLEAQIHNIIVYTININRAIGMLTEKMPIPRPDPFPAGARPVPPGAPMTPSTTEQLTGYRGQAGNVVPVFVEIFKQVKGIFVANPAEVMTQYTGGREFSFLTYRSLEEVVTKLGEELHSQYLLSYTPNNMEQGGWHDIRVEVARFGMEVRTRRGYWMASVYQ
jgi:VWFA-related protein